MKKIIIMCISFVYLLADAHVLIYHRFGDSRYPSTNTSTEQLRAHFDFLRDNNYTVVKLDDLIYKLKNKETIPDKWVAITIDDGYKSFYTNAFKIFKEYNYPFTIFAYVEATNRNYSDFMNWGELKEISTLGSVEYHSYSHPHMTNTPKEQLIFDFEKGIQIFEKQLGYKPKYFTYPYGEMNEATDDIVKQYSFDAVFNQNNGAINLNSNVNNLDRLVVVGNSNLKNLLTYEFLNATWIEPSNFPKDDNLTTVHVKTNTNETIGSLYVTGIGWKNVKITDGEIYEKLNYSLTNQRIRVIVKIKNKFSTKILIKDDNGAK